MRRCIQGLRDADRSAADQVLDGLFLVRVVRAKYRWHAQKPFYIVQFSVVEPQPLGGRTITGRVYCTPKALWKLSWFLRHSATTPNCSDGMRSTRRAVGLRGIVKIRHTVRNGMSLLNLEGFAPAGQWKELSVALTAKYHWF